MAERGVTPERPPRRAGLPAAASIAIVYVLSRVVTTLFLLLAAEMSGPGSRFGDGATASGATT